MIFRLIRLFKKIALPILIWVAFSSCGTGDISRSFTKSQAVRLLSASGEKSWNRISKRVNGVVTSLEDCELNNTLLIQVTSTDSTLISLGELAGCNINDVEADTLLHANWSLSQDIDLISTDTLALTSLTGASINPYVISVLTARKLTVQYQDDNADIIVEEYSF